MIAERFNTQPVQTLLQKHLVHKEPYFVKFMDLELLIHPEVFNPTYTKVSGFLAQNIKIKPGQSVLEMFCGSGAIGLSIIDKAINLVGVDISPKAIKCAEENAERLGVSSKAKFREGNLWEPVQVEEKFNVILANPPLLPAIPENLLEMAVADSPEMNLTRGFIAGLPLHLADQGYALMTFSNACAVYVGDPMTYIQKLTELAGMQSEILSEWNVGYEVYRVIRFTK